MFLPSNECVCLCVPGTESQVVPPFVCAHIPLELPSTPAGAHGLSSGQPHLTRYRLSHVLQVCHFVYFLNCSQLFCFVK